VEREIQPDGLDLTERGDPASPGEHAPAFLDEPEQLSSGERGRPSLDDLLDLASAAGTRGHLGGANAGLGPVDRPPGTGGRPTRKDEIEIPERGLYIESWLPERRSRRRPLLFVHGELAGSWLWERWLGYFAGRGWEGHALNLRNHFWSQTADPTRLSVESYVDDVVAALDRLGPGVVGVGHGMGGLLLLAAISRRPVVGYVLLSPESPAALRTPTLPHVIRSIPDVYGKELLGWETLPERLVREHRDLTLADVLRIQHLLGQRPHESGLAKRQILQGVPIDRQHLPDVPRLVIGAGLDRYVPEEAVERLAAWLGAEYEPFGAHSHFGLVLGERSYLQVAERVRRFLEEHRL
jgi:pimeloyl-ACP methyl ester carboxylesterase